jgi:hypothetical protein
MPVDVFERILYHNRSAMPIFILFDTLHTIYTSMMNSEQHIIVPYLCSVRCLDVSIYLLSVISFVLILVISATIKIMREHTPLCHTGLECVASI